LVDAVKQRIAQLQAADPSNAAPVPIELVTASASGLDPHVSPTAAHYQVARIAVARSLPKDVIDTIIRQNTEVRALGLFGEERVNVLAVNLALDRYQGPTTTKSVPPSLR
jgi:K+-transporting ATPase ATPase C chain